MDTNSTGMAGGKKEKTIETRRKQAEKILTKIPMRPRDHGPQLMEAGSRTRLMASKTMGIMYEVKRPAMVSDTMALKATVEAMLIRQIIAVNVAQKRMAFRGRAARELTYIIRLWLCKGRADGTYVRKEVGKRQATITSKSPGLTGC